MRCPFCSFADTQVKDSRPLEEGGSIKRRRLCPSCGGRFTTFERFELREINVIKRNGVTRPFDSTKLFRSIEVASRKRPIKTEQIEEMVSRIIKKMEKYGEGEIETKIIGELVLEELFNLDHVAYVRYASVYKDFTKASDFRNFIAKNGSKISEQ
jgi:transcriptional repressor NrdR